MSELSIIIPARNEVTSIEELFRRIDETLNKVDIRYEIIFMDSHSTDNSILVASQLTSRYPVHVYSQKNSKGKAGAILEGIAHAASPYIIMIDGDLQYPPEAIPTMYAARFRSKVVVARRKVYKERFIRKVFSFIHHFLFTQLLFGLRCDVQSGLKLFPRNIVNYLDSSYISSWTFDLALLYTAKKLGYSIGEVPIVFEERKNGASKVSILGSIWEHSISMLKFKFFPPIVKKRK
ncbi:MAG: glycosyltransferase [bacterium]|nr:glycosyltransferase [bacterium]